MAAQHWKPRLPVEPEQCDVASAGVDEMQRTGLAPWPGGPSALPASSQDQPDAPAGRHGGAVLDPADVLAGQLIGIPAQLSRRNADLLRQVAETLDGGGPKAARLRALLRSLDPLFPNEMIAGMRATTMSRRRH